MYASSRHAKLFYVGTTALSLSFFAVGCSESAPESGKVIKVDPAEEKNRQDLIMKTYKENPPNKKADSEKKN